MKELYVLQHYYEDEDWEEHGCYVGVFDTKEECIKAKEDLEKSGKYPDKVGVKNIYNISSYLEGEDNWTEGFV